MPSKAAFYLPSKPRESLHKDGDEINGAETQTPKEWRMWTHVNRLASQSCPHCNRFTRISKSTRLLNGWPDSHDGKRVWSLEGSSNRLALAFRLCFPLLIGPLSFRFDFARGCTISSLLIQAFCNVLALWTRINWCFCSLKWLQRFSSKTDIKLSLITQFVQRQFIFRLTNRQLTRN